MTWTIVALAAYALSLLVALTFWVAVVVGSKEVTLFADEPAGVHPGPRGTQP